MKKSKKVLIIILIVILVILSIIALVLFLSNKKHDEIQKQEEERIINAEENFKKLFENLEYTENRDEAVTLGYQLKKTENGKYDVNVNVPLFNIETDTATAINNEINNTFGRKLIEVVKESSEYTKYYVDYITYTNENVMSVVIRAVLKEGSASQRVIIKTYNYDLSENKLLTLQEYMELNNLDKSIVQSKIINYIREKSEGTDAKLAEEYNLYVRNVRSEEYLIENIQNYYIGQDGDLYILFPYGNNNATETVDVVIL